MQPRHTGAAARADTGSMLWTTAMKDKHKQDARCEIKTNEIEAERMKRQSRNANETKKRLLHY